MTLSLLLAAHLYACPPSPDPCANYRRYQVCVARSLSPDHDVWMRHVLWCQMRFHWRPA
jgi:hypothetical protein